MDTDREQHRPHGVRWPHECRECADEAVRSAGRIAHDHLYGLYRDDIQCHLVGMEYNARAHVGFLWLEPGNCTDMSGAIGLFKAIDPDVRAIFTFQVADDLEGSGIPDTAYILHAATKTWNAWPGETVAEGLAADGLLPLKPSIVITRIR